MSRFPDPLSVPEHVLELRQERLNQLIKSSKLGIAIRLAIIAFELFGVLLYGSSALMMDALFSLMDVASTVVLILCLKLAERPPDEDHPFGHGRYEPLAGFQLGLLLTFVGVIMAVQQVFQLITHSVREQMHHQAWLIPALAVILLEVCYQIVVHVAKKQNSPALAADALHYRIDSITSLFAMIALLFAAHFPNFSPYFDHTGALLITLLMIGLGIYAMRNNLHQLMDRIPDAKFFDLVRNASRKVAGVEETEKIRIQLYGPDAHVDIDVEVDPQLTVERSHEISQQVRVEIQKEWPMVRDVTVHIEPYYPNDH